MKNYKKSLQETFEEIKSNMNKLNRRPIIYITINQIELKLQKEIENSKLKPLYTDVWMTIYKLEQFEKYKSKIDFCVYRVDLIDLDINQVCV